MTDQRLDVAAPSPEGVTALLKVVIPLIDTNDTTSTAGYVV